MGTRRDQIDDDTSPPARRAAARRVSNTTVILAAAAVLVPAALICGVIVVRAVNNREVTNPVTGQVVQPGQLNPAVIVNPRAAADGWNLREFRDHVRKNGFTDADHVFGDTVYYVNGTDDVAISAAIDVGMMGHILSKTDGVKVTLCSNPKAAHDLAGTSRRYVFDYSRFVVESNSPAKIAAIAKALGVGVKEISVPTDEQAKDRDPRREMEDFLNGLDGKADGGNK